MLSLIITDDIVDGWVLLVVGILSISACNMLLCYVEIGVVHAKHFLFYLKSFLAGTVFVSLTDLEQDFHEFLVLHVSFMELLLDFVDLS